MEIQGTIIGKTTLKKNKVVGLKLAYSEGYYTATITKTIRYQHEVEHIDLME